MRELEKRCQRFLPRDPMYRLFNAHHRRIMADRLAQVLVKKKLGLPVPPFPPLGYNSTGLHTMLVTGEQESLINEKG